MMSSSWQTATYTLGCNIRIQALTVGRLSVYCTLLTGFAEGNAYGSSEKNGHNVVRILLCIFEFSRERI
jgi:hypothetical protein